MKRILFNQDHELFREQFRKFVAREVVPEYPQWEKDGAVPREVWRKAGAEGFLCPWLPEDYGGSGADFLYGVVMMETIAEMGCLSFFMTVHNDIVVPYLWSFGNEEQKRRWLPGCCAGEYITAVAMSEPGAGSDLQAISTRAVRDRDHYIINGQKTFVSNGLTNHLCVTAVKTNPAAVPAHRGLTLFVVEEGTPGFEKGRKLEKIGLRAQDTAELSFHDCRVPAKNRLGEEGAGFKMLMQKLPQERLVISIWCGALMRAALALTRDYINQRKAFGRPLSSFQNTRFKMAEMYTSAELTQVFLDRVIAAHAAGENVALETAMAKAWTGENLKTIVDQCLQFFGGYGYMEEYPIARMYRDARVASIFAGTTEIMKQIISREILGPDHGK